MKKLLILAILGFSFNLSAQSSNWLEAVEANSVRNFEGYLYQNGNDINQCVEVKGSAYHLLVVALKAQSHGLFDHILKNEDIDLTTICADKTILQYAVKYGEVSHIQKLLAAGADPQQLSIKGKSALDYAKKYEKSVIAGILKQQQ